MIYRPKHFIGETIEVKFDTPPAFEKTPDCPEGFVWNGKAFLIVEVLSQWSDFGRSGAMTYNMRPSNMKKALRRGSYGVGRFYFRVRTQSEQIFEMYYDRAVKNVDHRKG